MPSPPNDPNRASPSSLASCISFSGRDRFEPPCLGTTQASAVPTRRSREYRTKSTPPSPQTESMTNALVQGLSGTRSGPPIAAHDELSDLKSFLAGIHTQRRTQPGQRSRAAEVARAALARSPYAPIMFEDSRNPSPAPSFVSSRSGVDSIFDIEPGPTRHTHPTNIPRGTQKPAYDERSNGRWSIARDIGLEQPGPKRGPPSQPPNDVLPAPSSDFQSATPRLRCEFDKVHVCNYTANIDEEEALIQHYYDEHFQDLPPPPTCICTFCDDVKFEARGGDPRENFRRRMTHILEHFRVRSQGHLVMQGRVDFSLIEYLHENNKIDEVAYQRVRSEQQRCPDKREGPSIVSPYRGHADGIRIEKASPRKGREYMVQMALRQGREPRMAVRV